jgi:prepilin-type processing-associated H-X9-DG protein
LFCSKCGIEIPGCVSICPVCKKPIENIPQTTQQCTAKTTNKLAVASLIIGIISLLLPIALIPIILGTLAINRIRASNGKQTGHWMATAGSILGVIALLIIPVMKLGTHARDKAKQSSCASNLKQIALATIMYSEDYDNKLPIKSNWSDSTYIYINRYGIKTPRIFRCPMDKTQSRCSYSYNSKLNGDSLLNIKDPKSMQTYFDSKGGWNSSSPVSSAVPRHGDYSNFAFVDGHVKGIKTRKTHFLSFIYEFPFYMPRTIEDLRVFPW